MFGMNTEIIEKTFTCSDPPQLTLSNIRGHVNIQPGQNGQIAVKASKHVKSGDAENTRINLFQSGDSSVTVETSYNREGFGFFSYWQPCNVDYEVYVPAECSLRVRGVSNSATIESISGRIDLSTISGDIDFHSSCGEFKVKTVSGDVSGESLSGLMRMTSVSGDILLNGCYFPSLRGKTVSGDMLIETPLGDGPYQFNAVSGDIKLKIPTSLGVTIHSSSMSGKINASAQTSRSNHSRNNHMVEILGGGIVIRHHSISGDLFLEMAQNEGVPDITQEGDQQEDIALMRSEILYRVSNGDIDVNEAVRLIEDQFPAKLSQQ
jgi:DUF4097 and DUF4098 domain-containing protein YvlB